MLVVFGLFDTGNAEWPAGGAAAALRCALGMQDRLTELNRVRATTGRPPLETSIAVHAGEVVAGAGGAPRRPRFAGRGRHAQRRAPPPAPCRRPSRSPPLARQADRLP